MWKIIIYLVFMSYIVYWLIFVIRRRMVGEIYEACGVGIYFTLIFWSQYWLRVNIYPMRVIGYLLFVPAAFFVIASFVTLKTKGKPTDHWESTTVMIDRGVYRVTRHPMYLGTAIWSVALVLVIQSLIAVILAALALFCFWVASKKEEKSNIIKFGDEYKKYLASVPRWNFFKGLKHFNGYDNQ